MSVCGITRQISSRIRPLSQLQFIKQNSILSTNTGSLIIRSTEMDNYFSMNILLNINHETSHAWGLGCVWPLQPNGTNPGTGVVWGSQILGCGKI